MIVVRERTEEKFIKLLKTAREKYDTRRCLYLKTSALENPNLSGIEQTIYMEIGNKETIVLVCADNDIFIIASGINHKSMKTLHTALLKNLFTQQSFPLSLVSLFDLRVNWLEIMKIAEEKLDNKIEREKWDKARKKREQKEQAEKRREVALNTPVVQELVKTISQRREVREGSEILVVEDDPFSLRLVKSALNTDFNVSPVKSGQAAILQYVTSAPNIVFLDIGLPDISGHDVLEKLLEFDPHAFVVMLSGKGDEENIMKSLHSGAKGFVGKPFTKEKLLQYIQKSSRI